MLDLTASGSTGAINGALFQQADAPAADSGHFTPFLEILGNPLRGGGVESGYNTNGPLQFDTVEGRVTHALALSNVPVVEINGVKYREFVLDIHQTKAHPLLSLDEVQIFVGDKPRANGYNSNKGKLGGMTAVYDLDAGKDNWIKLNAGTGQGAQAGGDMRMYVPDSLFNGTYVFLYSQFGDHNAANGGLEKWGTLPVSVTQPPPASGVGSISGNLFVDVNQDGVPDDTSLTLQDWTVYVDANGNGFHDDNEVSSVTDSNGNYTLANLPSGNTDGYLVRVLNQGWHQTTSDPDPIFLTAGESLTNVNFGFQPGD
jgi:hypothetical protein